MYGFSVSMIACSCDRLKNWSGCLIKYWSRGLACATRIARASPPLLPARPACCRVDIMVPGNPEMRYSIKGTDINTELKRIRRYDGFHLTFFQLTFEPPSLFRKESGTVHGDRFCKS